MKFELFIARRVASSGQQSFLRIILRIAVVAVALSMSVMIVATALISGFKNQISDKIFGFWGHIHITDTNQQLSLLETRPVDLAQDFYPSIDTLKKVNYRAEAGPIDRLLGKAYVDVETRGGIRHIQQFLLKPGIIKTKKELEGIILKGISSDFDWESFNRFLVKGSPIQLSDSSSSNDIIISQQTADRLELDTGARFIVHFVQKNEQLRRAFTVVGIYKTGLEEYDRKFAIIDIRRIQQLLGWDETMIGGFEVFVDNLADLEVITEYLYSEVIPPQLYAESIREKLPNIFEWLELQNVNEAVILGLMLLVGIINMITALLILILERTNMIGTLKALGSNNWSIRKIFLYYAAYIVMLGLFWGNLIGLSLCFLQHRFGFIRLSEADYYLSVAPVELNFLVILGLNLLTLFTTLLFLLFPSWLVTRISPVKAIRFK